MALDFKQLYGLQDQVLDKVFSEVSELYLTGGTCLHRFILEKRYSEDLDFFANDSVLFYQHTRAAIKRLASTLTVSIQVETKDFFRIRVNNSLQVDFVNDHSEYFGSNTVKGTYRLDNVLNILSNKMTAILGRDDPKDIFDFYMICCYFSFDWAIIIQSVRKKFRFSLDDFIIRLESFPEKLLERIYIKDSGFLKSRSRLTERIISELARETRHIAFMS